MLPLVLLLWAVVLDGFDGRPLHFTFIGDSLTRYQFLSLVYYFEYGVWPGTPQACTADITWEKHFRPKGPKDASPNLHYNKYTNYWPAYFKLSTEVFDRMLCDCHRSYHIEKGTGRKMVMSTENRWYENLGLDVSASFFQWTNCGPSGRDGTLCGHYPRPGFQLPCPVGQCGDPHEWRMGLGKAMAAIVAPLQPTHVFVNKGLWPLSQDEKLEGFWQDLCHSTRAMQANGTQFYWLGTTFSKKYRDKFGIHLPESLGGCGWRFFDRFNFSRAAVKQVGYTSSFHSDDLHFRAHVYKTLNQKLLQQLNVTIDAQDRCSAQSSTGPPPAPQ